MSYSIREIASLTGLSQSTLRYYEKEGLLNNVERRNGVRKFEKGNIEQIRIIECLKNAGLSIEEIKEYMIYSREGDSSLEKRYKIILASEKRVNEQLRNLEATKALIAYKKWYYETAIKTGTEKALHFTDPESLSKEGKRLYFASHLPFKNEKSQQKYDKIIEK
ncbi:MAG TPA: MerR family transcriptional regulator [Firmicutes bacterium]|nr:MerR family transcriptional regulator [Bacillota bacterium]